MKLKMTVGHFQEKVLPLLRSGCKSAEELRTKAAEYVADIELTDDNGAPVEVETGDLELDAVEATETTEDLNTLVESAVAKAIASLPKPKVSLAVKRPTQIVQKAETTKVVFRPNMRAKNFKAENGISAEEKAYRFGRFLGAAVFKHAPSIQWCNDHGLTLHKGFDGELHTKVHQEGTNTTGGFLVPDEFGTDLIDLRLQYGVFRRNARTEPMSSDHKTRPRRKSGLTPYFTGESAAGTESTMGWDQVSLTAKKLMVLTKISNELNEDAYISLGDRIAGEIAYAFANREDECGFNGTGAQATYGGIVGVIQALSDMNGVDDGGGLVLAAGNAYSEITLQNFHSLIGRCPTYARRGAKFYASPSFHDAVMQARMTAAGGATVMEIGAGAPQAMFLGYPVELVEVMPTTEANSQICCLFGDLSLAADFGDRRGVTIATSDSALNAFEQDELVVRGTQRFDINVHDIGTASAAGPVVGLITAGS